jgi:hypothetical protein
VSKVSWTGIIGRRHNATRKKPNVGESEICPVAILHIFDLNENIVVQDRIHHQIYFNYVCYKSAVICSQFAKKHDHIIQKKSKTFLQWFFSITEKSPVYYKCGWEGWEQA